MTQASERPPHYVDDQVTLWHGDALDVLRTLPSESVNCVVTSPPYYGLRDYGVPGQYGLEPTPAAYVETMRAVFAEVRRVLAADGTLWLNLGDSYAAALGQGSAGTSATLEGGGRPSFRRDGATVSAPRRTALGLPEKNLLGIPWRVAFALQDDGWILRNAIVWHKPNGMPASVQDRLKCSYEHVFLFARSERYWFDLDPIREPLLHPEVVGHVFGGANKGTAGGVAGTSTERTRGASTYTAGAGRNPGDVWSISTQPFPEAHFAVMPPTLAERCVLSGCRPGGTVLDPFCGSGTSGMVALKHGRRFVGIDLSADYLDLALRTRLAQGALIVEDGAA